MWFDAAHVETVRDAFPEWMAFFFAFGSYLGSVWFVAPTVVLAFWFWDRHRFAFWLGIVMGGYALMVGLKGLFATPRPGVGPAIAPDSLPTVAALLYAPAVEIATMSFPSGHALAGTIIWTMLALESTHGTRRQRLAVAASMIVLISVSRVGVGVHYPIDVVAGVAVAVAYLAVALSLRDRLTARTNSARIAASTVFVLGAVLSLLAFRTNAQAQPNAVVLFGGCVGALLAWQYATPPREPWPVTIRVIVHAVVGIAVLALVALVLAVLDGIVIWFAVGVASGGTVVGLPRLVDETTAPRTRAEVPS